MTKDKVLLCEVTKNFYDRKWRLLQVGYQRWYSTKDVVIVGQKPGDIFSVKSVSEDNFPFTQEAKFPGCELNLA